VAASAADRDRLTEITKGADALYNCMNPRYHRWQQDWPPVADSLLATAEASGAVLVMLGNLYSYGPVEQPMTEDLPLTSTGVKGRVRAKMWADALAAHQAGRVRVTELRASDYFGPGALDQSYLGDRLVPSLLAGKRVSFLSDPDVPHSWTYLPNVAQALAVAAVDERAWGRAWHVPTGPAVSARAFAERLAALADSPAPRFTEVPRWAFNALGAVAPMMRELRETRYQFDRPYILDSSAFETTFGVTPTPLDMAQKETLAWWRSRLAA
jgi:nucleoside-diphosphate-sugar epimerase